MGRVLSAGVDSVTSSQGTPNTFANAWPVRPINALVTEAYDYIDLSYTGTDLTSVVFRTGGAAGAIVATITITYNGNGDIDTVTRT